MSGELAHLLNDDRITHLWPRGDGDFTDCCDRCLEDLPRGDAITFLLEFVTCKEIPR